MNRLATPGQLRASFFRWAMFLVPAVLLLGFLSGYLSGSGADNAWFTLLDKPATYPPPATFGIVWTALYIMMGLAFALVCSASRARYQMPAILAFILQLCVNLAWSPIFFAAHEIDTALLVIMFLDVAAIITIALFWGVRRLAAVLMLPYLAWILFATVLNWQFLQLNPDAEDIEFAPAVERLEL